MNKFFLLVCLYFHSAYSYGQTDSLLNQINNDVWYPFIQSFNQRDEAAFPSVHSREVTRVIRDDNRLLTAEEYFKPIPESVQKDRQQWARQIELRFIQRIAGNDRAFEVGYYKTSNRNTKTGETRVHFGKFHVLLRKEAGKWKILMDADRSEGVGENEFNSATPLVRLN